MTKRAISLLALALFSVACQGKDSSENGSPTGPPPVPRSCPTRPGGITTYGLPPFTCGPGGPATFGVMSDLNGFWQSSAVACVCQFDAPPLCQSNAFATSSAPGYIFYDASFLNSFVFRSNSYLPSAYVLAHEFGHDIQIQYGIQSPVQISNELGADCFAGYFVGWLTCQGRANQNDIEQMISQACNGGDPAGVPWWDSRAHGTCEQRVAAVRTGMASNEANIPPINACGSF